MKTLPRALKSTTAIGLALALGVTVSACNIGEVESASDSSEQTATETTESFAPPVVSVGDGATKVSPVEPVTVEAEAGIRSAQMTNESGKVVKYEFNSDMTQWSTAEPLGYGRTYTLKGTDRDGTSFERTFTTVAPAAQSSVYFALQEGAEVGVGQAIPIHFSYAPGDKEKAQEAIKVTTSNDTEGGFYWQSDNVAIWRPKDFWEPGTQVTVTADIYGVDLGGGVYGADKSEMSFTVGDEVLTTVDNATKTLTVTRNGEVVRSFPVSLGRPGRWETPNGTYVVGDKNESMVMDSTTYGLSLDAGGYKTPVKYATQLSYSGIYVHSAPWALGALGSYNQSHGCINASPEDAQWYQATVKRGDPVKVVNTGGDTLAGWDGLGYWNLSWDELNPDG
ncbi:Ig-like domain-containing protein [Corynebacterium sanguinis]|uniref:L,D-transpeptidase n=1 Tax=Corynebacterium sanguinis TaxID=2594913 RepID=UPI00223B017F|nr:Ig-like domain-containing protein [Corynebacterium sanguinis]MCT2288322.1 Ig-like domain-containing protein [Corynebacterium sanguinis]